MKLPNNWKLVNLIDVCKIGAGNSAPQGDVYFDKGEYLFVRMQDLSDCESMFLTETQDKVNQLAIDRKRLKLWPKNSLVIPKSGASILLNHRALLGSPAFVVSHLAIIVPGEWILPEYLYFFFLTVDSARYVPDTNYPSLRLSDIERIKMILPPLPEQQRIVGILSEADNLRDLRRKVDEHMKGLLPNLFEEKFGIEVADRKYWDNRRIKDLGNISYGLTVNSIRRKADNECPYLRVGNVYRWNLNLSDVATIGTIGDDIEKYQLRNGDVLVVEGHANPNEIGRASVWNNELPLCLHQNHLLRIRPNLHLATSNFISGYINSNAGKQYMLRYGKTSSGLNTINSTDLGNMPIVIPPIEQQLEFEELYAEYKEIEKISLNSVTTMAKLFQSLLSRAFTGELSARWRATNAEMLHEAAVERDIAIGERPKEPRLIDFKTGMVTQQEREEFNKMLQNTFQPAIQQMLESVKPVIQLEDLTRGYMLDLSNLVTPLLAQNLEIVNASILRNLEDFEESTRESLASSVSSLTNVQKQFEQQLTSIQNDVLRVAETVARAAAEMVRRPDESHPRYHILNALSDEQYWVYISLRQEDGYFTVESICEAHDFSPEIVRRCLSLFDNLGLIERVSIPFSPTSEYTFYVDTYRLSNPEDPVWAEDVASIQSTF